VKILLNDVWRMARRRDPGFLDELLEHARLDGEAIVLTPECAAMLEARWPERTLFRGLGDVVHLPEQRSAPGGCC
jgi:hypothetical protein